MSAGSCQGESSGVRQFQKRPQPIEFGFAVPGQILPGIAPANRAANGDHHDIDQFMTPRPLDARFGQIFKRLCNTDNDTFRRHGTAPSQNRHPRADPTPTLDEATIHANMKPVDLDAEALPPHRVTLSS